MNILLMILPLLAGYALGVVMYYCDARRKPWSNIDRIRFAINWPLHLFRGEW